MATAVCDLDYHQLPDRIDGLGGYDRLFALVRLGKQPVGQILLPITGGHVNRIELRKGILDSVDLPFWQVWTAKLAGYDQEKPGNRQELKLSIAICTRDRPADLRRCLEGVVNLAEDGQEILVIDSASSTDETRKIALYFPGVRYLREDIAGLDRARNLALREASGDIVAFIDDDAVPDPGWLQALGENFRCESVMCVTGLTLPLELETPAQEIFERFFPFGRGYIKKQHHQGNIYIFGAGKAGAGVNMAFRKSVLEWVGPFDEALDAGTPTHSGGETEMFYRLLAHGYRIVYAPEAINWHCHRRTWGELRRTVYGYGVGTYAAFTSQLIKKHEFGVLYVAWLWFWHDQLPGLVRAFFRRPGSMPMDLRLAELAGCIIGPWAYLRSLFMIRKSNE